MARKRAKRITVEGFQPSSNPEQAHWRRELSKSNAAVPHIPKPRKGSRRQRERDAIRDQRRDQSG